jgi:Tetratricopeptide repeat
MVMEGSHMVSVIVVIAVIGVGWMVWRRLGRWHTPAVSGTVASMTPESLAFEAFTHGNTCLAAGQFAEATEAFQRARALDPKRPHVAERLAEVARRQAAASQPPAATAF